MKLIHRTTAVSTVLALSLAAATAQDEREPPPGGATGPAPVGKRVPKSDVPVSVPIADLAAERVAEVLEAIRALKHETFLCAACNVRSPQDGKCTRCGEPFEKETEVH